MDSQKVVRGAGVIKFPTLRPKTHQNSILGWAVFEVRLVKHLKGGRGVILLSSCFRGCISDNHQNSPNKLSKKERKKDRKKERKKRKKRKKEN